MPKTKEVFVRRGYYTADQIADFLVFVADSPIEAKKALTRALDKKPPKQTWVLYCAAYLIQQRTGCADSTALKKVAGRHWRSLWDKLQKRKLTLEQLVKNTHNNS